MLTLTQAEAATKAYNSTATVKGVDGISYAISCWHNDSAETILSSAARFYGQPMAEVVGINQIWQTEEAENMAIEWDNTVENDGYTVAISDGVEAYRADTELSLREAAEEFARTYDHNAEPGTVRCTATDLRTGESHGFSFDESGEVER